MEHGFYHPSRGYWQTTSEPSQAIRNAYPEGTVEVPLKPGAGFEWDGSEWVAVPPDMDAIRAATSMPKDDFIMSALDAGILTEADAEEATTGWPSGWDAFFTGKPARERIEAKARWASATRVRRMAPLVAALAGFKDLTDAEVDALFGIGG